LTRRMFYWTTRELRATSYWRLLLTTLEGYLARLETILDQIDQSAEDGSTTEEATDGTEDPFGVILDGEQVVAKLQERINSSSPQLERPDSRQLVSQPAPQLSVRLPKLTLPSFDGDVLKWQEFWDAFHSAVHDNKLLSKVEKFNYLNAQLMGKAKLCIAGLSLTSDNYDIAVSMLQDRFANNQIIVNSHYKSLMDLKALKTNETSKLRLMFDIIEKHTRFLSSLGEDTNSNFFFSLIMRKLPLDLVVKIEEQNLSNTMDVPTLFKIVRNFIQAREKSERYYYT
jgi:hypothetical protein